MWHSQCFKVQILKTKNDPLDVSKATPIYQINGCEHFTSYFKRCPPHHEADPFLFVYRDRLFLFYESMPFHQKGIIYMVSTDDLKHWSKPIAVLEESFHLSYPCVFMDNGDIYMIPESCNDFSIRLYKADNDDSTSFSLCKKLVTNAPDKKLICSFCDTSIWKDKGVYYLFTSLFWGNPQRWVGVYSQELYMSDKLDGEYKKHPCITICKSNKYGRNGGHIFSYNNKLYRVAQDCSQKYGGDINLLEIKKLSPDDYEEVPSTQNLLCNRTPYYKHGGHQYHFVTFKEWTIIATDATETKMFIFAKIINLIKRFI